MTALDQNNKALHAHLHECVECQVHEHPVKMCKQGAELFQEVVAELDAIIKKGVFCKYCGATDDTVRLIADPYAAEIHEDYTQYWICDKCYGLRAEDI